MILIDSNVLIYVLGDGQSWREWSISQLSVLAADNHLVINQIAYGEVAPKQSSLDYFNDWLAKFEIEFEPLGEDAAYCAGLAFDQHCIRRRRHGVPKGSILADFFIGGHAQVLGATILTRDPRFYRTYFPTVSLITPETAEP